jgi:hypothetical protein
MRQSGCKIRQIIEKFDYGGLKPSLQDAEDLAKKAMASLAMLSHRNFSKEYGEHLFTQQGS